MSSLPRKQGSVPATGPDAQHGPLPGWPVGYAPENPVAAILEVLGKGERFLVCSHSRPDGDAVGSMLAMGMLLRQMGKHADLVTADSIPAVYRDLPGADGIRLALRVRGAYDAVILLECDSLDRAKILGLEPYFHINIDHHTSGKNYGRLNWILPEAASVGELVFRLVKAAGATITPEMAVCLYTTVLTDTGGFCYGGTKASTFEVARELAEAGADPIQVARKIYYSTPVAKLKLLGAALSTLHVEDGLAWLWVTNADVERTAAAEEDHEGIVDHAVGVAGVQAAVYLRELPEGRIRLSLRSKGSLDVAAIAERLGGGGHEKAAGLTLEGPLEQAREEILAVLRNAGNRS